MSHTPKPWGLNNCESGNLPFAVFDRDKVIARVATQADAVLIQHATDLLEALEAYVAWMKFDGDAITEHKMFLKAEKLADAAIAKAKGESQ